MRQDKLLDQYLDELAKNPNARPPAGLDPETAEFARQLFLLERAVPSIQSKNSIWHAVANPQLSNGRSKSPQTGRYIEMQHTIPYTTQPPLKMAWLTAAVVGGLILLVGLLIYDFSNNNVPPGNIESAGSNILQATDTPEPPPTSDSSSNFDLPAYQTEPIQLEVGETVEGTFAAEQDRFIYAFNGKAGDILRIRLVTTGSASVGFQLLDRPQVGQPSGQSGGGGGGGSGGSDDVPHEFVMPLEIHNDAIVWVVVNSNDQREKEYSLTIKPVTGTPITYGTTASGSFSSEANANFFEFEGERGDILTITTASELDLQMRLETLTGEEIASDDDSGTSLNPELYRVQLPETGSYRIRVEQTLGVYYESAAGEVVEVPDYELSLAQIEPVSLEGQQTIDLLPKKPAEVLTFDAEAGETYTLRASTFFTADTVSIVVMQGNEELAAMGLLPPTGPTSNEISATREFTVPESGQVKIFVNYAPTDRNSIVTLNISLD